MATLRISLKKVTSEVKFAERKSPLLQNNNVWKKILPFVQSYKVTPPLHHSKNNFMSKWHLIQPLRRETHKKPTLISYILVRTKNLWSRITLYRACTFVFGLSTLWPRSTTPIGSPRICMWSPADICEQWERIYLPVQQTFVGQERVTNPLERLRGRLLSLSQTLK